MVLQPEQTLKTSISAVHTPASYRLHIPIISIGSLAYLDSSSKSLLLLCLYVIIQEDLVDVLAGTCVVHGQCTPHVAALTVR